MEQYPVTFDHRILDVTDVPAIHRLVEDAFHSHDRIDVVVSNADYKTQRSLAASTDIM